MPENRAQRTLVKSPPELWAEISDAAALARRLEAFGEVRITRLEPETAVAWEGDTARGTVELEPSGWGTRVTIAAETRAAEPEPVAEAVEEVEHEAEAVEPVATVEAEAVAEAEPVEEPEAEPVEPVEEPEAEPVEPVAEAEPVEPVATTEIEPAAPEPRRGLFARLFGRRRAAGPPEPAAPDAREPEPATAPAPEPAAQAEPEPQPAAQADPLTPPEVEPEITATAEPEPQAGAPAADLTETLTAVLDGLGSANHRPFSRS